MTTRPGRAGVLLAAAAALLAVTTALAHAYPQGTGGPPPPAKAGQAPPATGSFGVVCRFSHRAPDDPIVAPGQPGAAHLHEFFGSRDTDAHSTRASLLRAPTTCSRPANRSAYWVPALLRRGEPVEPLRATAYYLTAGRHPRTLRPFRSGLRVISGDGKAAGRQSRAIVRWFCGSREGPRRHAFGPVPCRRGEVLQSRTVFPDCANGRRDSSDHKRHMAFSYRPRDGGRHRVCPWTHPIAVPRLRLTVSYPHHAAAGSFLSSGGRLTLHADFFEAWVGRAQSRLVANCLRTGRRCGV